MFMYDYIIIGAGVSGIVSAINLSRHGNRVIVLERNSKPLRKLLVTGNGHCNLYNENQDYKFYHSNDRDLISKIINDNNLDKYKSFLDSIGIFLTCDNGYYYPYSKMSSSVSNALLKNISHLNINIICNYEVNDIKYDGCFKIGCYTSKNIVITTGSPAWYGKSNTLNLLDKLNIDYIPFTPSLCKIKTNQNFKDISGVRAYNACLSFYGDGNKIKDECGMLLFKDHELSGICSFNLSNLFYKYSKSYVLIDFLHDFSYKDVYSYIDNKSKMFSDRLVSEILDTLLNYKIIKFLIKEVSLSDKCWNSYSNDDKKKIVDILKGYKVSISGTDDFKSSQTVSGGVRLSNINLNTMEARKHIYVSGEAIDLDGDCGGYNLTIAFITGLMLGGYND